MKFYYEMRAEKAMTPIEFAKGRLAEWGEIIKQVVHSGAPNPNYYSKSPFTPGALDCAAVLEFGERGERALEVDVCVQQLELVSMHAYYAIIIHYLISKPGKKSRLRLKDRVRMFRNETGMSERSLYNSLAAGENWVLHQLSIREVAE